MKHGDVKQSREADTASDEDGQGECCDKNPNCDRPHADKKWPDRSGCKGIDELMDPACHLVTQTFDWVFDL